MRILIITSCTGEKVVGSDRQLTAEDFKMGKTHVTKREKELKDLLRSAGEMYSGEQHVRLMRGVEESRKSGKNQIDFHVLSAGYGLIAEDRMVAPYEITFATMKTKELREWADTLNVPEDFRKVVSTPYDLAMILLGDNYLTACALDAKLKFGGPTLIFCGTGMAKKLPEMANVRVVSISNPEAKRFSCGLIGLKGELATRVLGGIANTSTAIGKILDHKFDVLAWLDGIESSGSQKSSKPNKDGEKATKPEGSNPVLPEVSPKVDWVVQIPQSWWDKPHRKKLQYFIPEWDDLVDQDYDFQTDTHSGENCGWGNAVYAHQLYPEPNYDGLLMSRAVAEKSKAKKERVNAMGVHRMLRVPRELPIMGDCGAFDYIMEEVPPYSTADVLDYYTRLGFDFGVSVDHLIVSATEEQKKFRYDLTISNAADFLKEHRKAGLKWQPIGAVQGWDPGSYAKAATQYVKMGYRYIGLGGLVRSSTKDIFQIIRKVREKVPAEVSVHLFGIARLDSMNVFADAGVQSADSASYLRQAWMRLHQSYASVDGPYAALRIPEAGKSFRAKHMLEHPDMSDERILQMEQTALKAARGYGERKTGLEETLGALLDYDQFVTKERVSMEPAYRRTLEDRPWEKCECSICQTHGIEVIIFRGNNRNRRRGFHNTWVFYRLLQRVLAGETVPFLAGKGLDPSQLDLQLA